MRLSRLIASVLVSLPAAGLALEISTGFLIGPRYDPRAFYVRNGAGNEWRKTNSGPGFRKSAQGKLVGVALPAGAPLSEIRRPGVSLISVPMQRAEGNSFRYDGTLDPQRMKELDALLAAASRSGLVVELVLFDPAYDQEFHSPVEILAAAHRVTGWLIDRDHRHVIISFASDWTAPGWDFDTFVPLHLEQLAEAVRGVFSDRRTDYALPIAMSVHVRLNTDSPIIAAADLLLLGGEALSIDMRKVERPAIVVEDAACVSSFDRASGCLVGSADSAQRLTPLLFTRPPRPGAGPQ